MNYDIKCKSCDYEESITCSIKQYETMIVGECPKCTHKTLYQDFTNCDVRKISCSFMPKYTDPRIQRNLDSALRESDYLEKKNKNSPPPPQEQ